MNKTELIKNVAQNAEISQKEATVSDDLNNQLNEFVKIFEDGFVQLENGITNFFNKFNKH